MDHGISLETGIEVLLMFEKKKSRLRYFEDTF